VGSLAAIATTTIEMKYGFTAAFSVPTIVFFIGFAAILLGKKYLVHHPPTHSILFHGSKVLWIAAKNGFNLSAAKKSAQSELEHPEILHWDDIFVDELSTAFRACRLFLFYPFYWVAYNQFLTNFISQAATMDTHSIPNDILINIEPISVLIFLLLLDRVIYPLLQRAKIPFKPITRIATGFLLVSAAMAYAAFVQNTIYTSPPCFQYPRAEDCRSGKVPNRVHVALQTPAYILIAMSETLASVSGAEYAYTNAPASMKSIVMALYLSTSSVGAGFAILLTPLTVDPLLTWMYSALSVEAFVSGVALWVVFSWL
jgi:POT family proton-dependent oligopeptide transporter